MPCDPTKVCRLCGTQVYWESVKGMIVCVRCHPPAAPHLVKAYIIPGLAKDDRPEDSKEFQEAMDEIFEERAGMRELGGFSREEAEKLAREDVEKYKAKRRKGT